MKICVVNEKQDKLKDTPKCHAKKKNSQNAPYAEVLQPR